MKRMAAVLAVLFGAGFSLTVQGADFNGDSRDDIAIFRPSTGLWAVRNVTRVYFGGAADDPVVGDYDGDGRADIAVYRSTTGLWAVRSVTRAYFGGSADNPITGGGGGQRLYDYVVKPSDGADLVRALESDTYRSVFIPAGTYNVHEVITVDNVRKIVGEEQRGTRIIFLSGSYLDIFEEYCKVEGIYFFGGGVAGSRGSLYVRSNYVTVRDCLSEVSDGHGFQHASGGYVSFIDCIANQADDDGFRGSNSQSCRFVNCAARNCAGDGFEDCHNLSNCYVDGYGNTGVGFRDCDRISTSYAYNCVTYGFYGCNMVSACMVDGGSTTPTAFSGCYRLSACLAQNCTGTEYDNCHVSDDATNKYSCN